MIDFNKAERLANKFLGSERKATVRYEGIVYMLKFPDPVRKQNIREVMSYKNNQYSEHIGSTIFRSCGIPAQKTKMGYFTDSRDKRKVVAGCQDFTQDGDTLYEMTKLVNDCIEIDNKLATRIDDVYTVISSSHLPIDKKSIIEKFWDMFVVDALIGNSDRHFGNWGLIEKGGEYRFAPVYDCGSALAALKDDDTMSRLLNKPSLLKVEEYNIHSIYVADGKRISYHETFRNPPEDLVSAILRVVPRIDMDEIHSIIDQTPTMSDIRKTYLKEATKLRHEQIISPAYKRLTKDRKPTLAETLKINGDKAKEHNAKVKAEEGHNRSTEHSI